MVMVSRSMVSTFSYNVKDADIIREAEVMAKQDGRSFSELVIRLIKEEVQKKE